MGAKSLEDLAVVRAVHGLEHELLALLGGRDRAEGVCSILSPVSRGHIELLRPDVWGDNLLVAELLLDLLEELLEAEAKLCPPREPEGKTCPDVLREGEEP